MKILAIGAHPDDIEFGCAPALMKEIRRGNEARMIVLSRGEAGSAGTPEIRQAESRQAARLIGASIDFWDFGGDCNLQHFAANSIKIAAEIRNYRPEIVLAPDPEENQHPDHAAAGKLARDACRFARYGGLLRDLPAHRITALYFYTITRHTAWSPDLVIDIGEVIRDWEAVMRCHATQIASKNYLDLQLTSARVLGLSAGVEYAIGFKVNDPIRIDFLSDLTRSSRSF
ncbi:MAG TPA: PIG-L family deacetylase [Bryobacteraceae bacterium]|nr:PIG-L family deacetylase [Bryobacteraceae bacterium]